MLIVALVVHDIRRLRILLLLLLLLLLALTLQETHHSSALTQHVYFLLLVIKNIVELRQSFRVDHLVAPITVLLLH